MNLRKARGWSCVVLLVLLVLLGGCAAVPQQSDDQPIYWPNPPAAPRFVHVATLVSGESIRRENAEGRLLKALRGVKNKGSVFAKPFGVAAKNGLVVVTDTVLRQGFIFNLQRQKLYPLGRVGKKGVLIKPLGVTIGANSQIYIADASARKVIVYDAFGMHLSDIGDFRDLDRPVDVAVSPDGKQVYVVDAGGIDSRRHRVVVYSSVGVKLFEFGWRGNGTGEFNLPTQVEVASDGTVYVLDAGNFRVQVFSADGQFQRAWGRVGRGFGDFARPRGLAVGGDGNVYVSDAAFRNVQVFNPKGELLLAIGGKRLLDRAGELAMPADIAVDELQHLYIVDQVFKKVEVLRQLSEQEMDAIVARRQDAQ
ncbi:MAG: 6-bladed beta-propeller [Gammaproteobacteria bacterium]|nr:6-bladed beta-propeller [Gammaproteobacteria bacterium]